MQTNKLLALKMTDNYSFPITPPPELFAEWLAEAKRLHPGESTGFIAGEVARLAYQAGADTELEACCEWFKADPELVDGLRAARRPKPPSLKKQAQVELDRLIALIPTEGAIAMAEPIRRALEQLDD